MGRYKDSNLYALAYNYHFPQQPYTVTSDVPVSFPRLRGRYSRMDLMREAWAAANKYGYNPALFVAQIWNESHFDPNAISRDKRGRPIAYGVAQIIPSTAHNWHVNPMNPKQALNASAKAMAGYYKTYKRKGYNDVDAHKMAMAAYNAGPGSVKKYRGVPPFQETINYVARIFRDRKLFK